MNSTKSRTKSYSIGLLVTLLLTAGNAAILNTSEIVNMPLLFGGVIIFQLLLTVLIIFFLIVVLRTPLRIIISILASALKGVESNRYIKVAERRFPFVAPWLKRRFSLRHSRGIILTTGTIIAVLFLFGFISVAQAVITHGLYVGVDHRVLNLMPYIRTPSQTTFYSFFTFIASPAVAIGFIAVVGVIALLRRQYWLPVVMITAAGSQAVIIEILKLTVHRPRPDISLRLVAETGFSFPSGHVLTTTVIYGLTAYFLFRFTKSYVGKLLIVLGAVILIVLVATSRVYFGVHYPTDVVASMYVGGVVLTILITVIEINQHFKIIRKGIFTNSVKKTLVAALLLTVVVGIVLNGRFTHLQTNVVTTASTPLLTLDQRTVLQLPRYSESLTGVRMEPVNLIFVGTNDQVKAAFTRAGWFEADRSTLGNTFHAFLSAAKNEQYLNAPVTPSYLNLQPETIAFEQPTSTDSLRQRHHTRLWKTNFVIKGTPIWVATASFDKGIGIGLKVALPTHHIDPNVDTERTYISQSLGYANAQLLKVVDAEDGHNASGDSFFTDGQAAVIVL
jgi:membrane-associated phospholipid phosphatase